jgi:type III secretory pathway component EscU
MAVRLMYAGAAVSALSLIVGLATVGSVRSSLHKADPKLTAAQLHSLQNAFVIGSAVFQVILIALWVWMALMNKAGKSWARIVAAVLFGLNSLILLVDVARAGGSAAALVGILTWLIGLGAVIFLWRKDASEYFTAQSGPRVR